MKAHRNRNSVMLVALGLVLALSSFAFFKAQPGSTRPKALPQGVRGEPISSPASGLSPAIAAGVAKPHPAGRQADYLAVGFDTLGTFPVEADPINGSIKLPGPFPANIRALNEKAVSVEGFMLPLKGDAGLITDFLLLKDQTQCCYGGPQNLAECVEVRMAGRGVKAAIDIPVTAYGIFRVGEIHENGFLTGIYQLTGERLEIPTK